jgi:hypothetical protein
MYMCMCMCMHHTSLTSGTMIFMKSIPVRFAASSSSLLSPTATISSADPKRRTTSLTLYNKYFVSVKVISYSCVKKAWCMSMWCRQQPHAPLGEDPRRRVTVLVCESICVSVRRYIYVCTDIHEWHL